MSALTDWQRGKEYETMAAGCSDAREAACIYTLAAMAYWSSNALAEAQRCTDRANGLFEGLELLAKAMDAELEEIWEDDDLEIEWGTT